MVEQHQQQPAAPLLPDVPDVWLAEASRLLPEILIKRPDLSPPPNLPPDQARVRLFEALSRLMLALVRASGAAIIVLDDLGQADPASLAWLDNLLTQVGRLPLGIAVAYRRSDDSAALARWLNELARLGLQREIPLTPLDDVTIADLLRQVGLPGAVTGSLAQRLWNETGGNPFFVLETVRTLQEQQTDLTRVLNEPLPRPASVQDVMRARMQLLDEPTRHVLHACAVTGRSFDADLVQVVSGYGDHETLHALDLLLSREFLQPDGPDYRFAHDHVAEAAYTLGGSATRRRYHQRAATVLHRRLSGQDADPTLPSTLAMHYERSGQSHEAASCWLLAGQRAWSLFAAEEALHCFASGLNCASDGALRFDLLAGQEEVLHYAGHRDEQQQCIATLEQMMRDDLPHQRSTVMYRRGRLAVALNQWAAAEIALRQSLAAAQAHDPATETTRCLLATTLLQQQRRTPARQVAETARQQAAQRGDAVAQATCLLTLADIARSAEDLALSEQYLQQAIEQAHAATDQVTQARLLINLSTIAFQHGRFSEALHYAQDAVRLHQAQANREGEAEAHTLVAMALARLQTLS
ncbi:MAG: tetratricopeptide repeat protein [Chloroflexaceae bacterium]|nr:tetratricopeptide repeat protein [Chloroflexaceae bacterium]